MEREIALSRRAFVLGVPTAISFGIVSVGEQYGAMYELVEADTLTGCILHSPSRLDYYAGIMADVARQIHSTKAQDNDPFPDARERVREYILNGVARSDKTLADRCLKLVDQMPATRHLIHGDFHTSNVFLQNSEPLLIDMDRLATGDPVIELGDIYMYYIVPGEKDGVGTDPYLGISFQLCRRFFRIFMERYLQTQDENRIREAVDKAELLGNLRRINRLWKSGTVSPGNEQELEERLGKTAQLADRIRDLRIFQEW